MVNIREMLDFEALTQAIEAKMVTCKKHPREDLVIYCYSNLAQVKRLVKEPHIGLCRGLITDLDGEVVARPFGKFFHASEHRVEGSILPPIPDEPFEIFDKVDGSMGVLYHLNGENRIATKARFDSPQAERATEMLHEKYSDYPFEKNLTYLFEIIYPENQLVLSYPYSDLVLLAVIDTETGKDVVPPTPWPGRTPEPVSFDSFDEALAFVAEDKEWNGKEGFVAKFASGLRVKMKFAEYVRQHRTATDFTSVDLYRHLAVERCYDPETTAALAFSLGVDKKVEIPWMLSNLEEHGSTLAYYANNIPDEMHQWLRSELDRMGSEMDQMVEQHEKVIAELNALGLSRKEIVPLAKARTDLNFTALMRGLSGEAFEFLLWKHVKPAYSRPHVSDLV